MDRTGHTIGEKYRLVRLLGEGGMGAVYEARHTMIGRRCAVKFLHPEFARQRDVVTRFVREAQAASAIGHRGIIDIYDVGTTPEGTPYLVMEFLDGVSVARRLEAAGRLPVGQAVEIVAQALSALDVAHQRGIVHRDLKPDNLYVVQTPGSPMAVKVLDFGISKVALAGASQQRVTQTGAVLGTPVYMSPEQAAGHTDVDHRLDIYAMGVILFELLTGRVPFDGDNTNQVLAGILTLPFPRPRTIDPAIPPALEEVILKATARDRDERFSSAEAMLQALLPFLDAAALVRLGLAPEDAATASAAAPAAAGKTAPPTAMVQLADRTGTVLVGRRRSVVLIAAAGPVVALTIGLLVWAPWSGSAPRSDGAAPPAAAEAASPARITAAPVQPVVRPVAATAAPPADGGASDVAPEAAASAPAPDAVVAVPEPPPLPAAVTIDIRGLPEGAQVSYDGTVVGTIPFQVTKSTASVALVINAPGYLPLRRRITPNQDVSLVPDFRRVPGVRPPPPPPEGPPGNPPATTVPGARDTEILTTYQ